MAEGCRETSAISNTQGARVRLRKHQSEKEQHEIPTRYQEGPLWRARHAEVVLKTHRAVRPALLPANDCEIGVSGFYEDRYL